MTRILRSVVLLPLLCTCLVGCLHLEQEIVLSEDGSAVFRFHYSVAEDRLPALTKGREVLDGWQGTGEESLNWFTDERAVCSFFEAAGLEVPRYRNYPRGGRRHVEVTVSAPDGAEALNRGLVGPFRLETLPGGKRRLKAVFPAELTTSGTLPEADLRALRALCDDLELVLRITVPGEIVSSGAHSVRERTASWVFKAGKDDSFLSTTPEIEVVFR